MENEVIPQAEVALVKTKIESMKEKISSIVVTNEEELRATAGHIGNIKKMYHYIEQEMDKYIKPAKEIIKNAKDQYNPFLLICDEVEKLLKDRAKVFMEAEAKRIELAKVKEIKKVESGYQKEETAVKKISEMPEAKKTVKGEESTLIMKKVKVMKIVDEKLIPEEFYKPRELDLVKIKKVALAGVVIPGVEVVEESQMSSR